MDARRERVDEYLTLASSPRSSDVHAVIVVAGTQALSQRRAIESLLTRVVQDCVSVVVLCATRPIEVLSEGKTTNAAMSHLRGRPCDNVASAVDMGVSLLRRYTGYRLVLLLVDTREKPLCDGIRAAVRDLSVTVHVVVLERQRDVSPRRILGLPHQRCKIAEEWPVQLLFEHPASLGLKNLIEQGHLPMRLKLTSLLDEPIMAELFVTVFGNSFFRQINLKIHGRVTTLSHSFQLTVREDAKLEDFSLALDYSIRVERSVCRSRAFFESSWTLCGVGCPFPLNVLPCGPKGGGKSSTLNTLMTAMLPPYRGQFTGFAVSSMKDHTTTKLHGILATSVVPESRLDFKFMDMWGLNEGNFHNVLLNFKLLLSGQIQEGTSHVDMLGDRMAVHTKTGAKGHIHCLLLVLPCSLALQEETMAKAKQCVSKWSGLGLHGPVVIITGRDVKNTVREQLEVTEHFQRVLACEPELLFFVENYANDTLKRVSLIDEQSSRMLLTIRRLSFANARTLLRNSWIPFVPPAISGEVLEVLVREECDPLELCSMSKHEIVQYLQSLNLNRAHASAVARNLIEKGPH